MVESSETLAKALEDVAAAFETVGHRVPGDTQDEFIGMKEVRDSRRERGFEPRSAGASGILRSWARTIRAADDPALLEEYGQVWETFVRSVHEATRPVVRGGSV
jgi:hypothetical protein